MAPLTGVVCAVLGGAAFAIANGPGGSESSGRSVIAFYVAHSGSQQASDYLWALAFAFFVLFAGSLRGFLRTEPAAEAPGSVAFAGAAVMAAGAGVYFGLDYALAVAPGHLDPAAAQALNVAALNLGFPVALGGFVFGVASGLAILVGASLPKWLGWAAIVIGIVSVTPAMLAGVVLYFVWAVIVGILIWRRGGPDRRPPVPNTLDAAD